MKKAIFILIAGLVLSSFAGCKQSEFNNSGDITVISREQGSGTRGAFTELFQVEQKNSDGQKVDYTVETADITNSTAVMRTSVSQNSQAIGYISLGSLDDSVKALKIDGVAANLENIKNKSYKIYRPFNIVTKGDISQGASDFISFILSKDGQSVVEDTGYIAVTENSVYSGTKPSSKVTIAGSSSVSPLMERLKEAYLEINPNISIEINQSDSTSGINSVVDGVCDIGMASRTLKDSEIEKGVTPIEIAIDGLAVIVHNNNEFDGLSSEQIKDIYTGRINKWSELS